MYVPVSHVCYGILIVCIELGCHEYDVYNSYLTVIWVLEMHSRMHPNYWQMTILVVVDLCSPLAYFMMTQPLPVVGKLPIKTLVTRQLPTNSIVPCIHVYTYIQCVRCTCLPLNTYTSLS